MLAGVEAGGPSVQFVSLDDVKLKTNAMGENKRFLSSTVRCLRCAAKRWQ